MLPAETGVAGNDSDSDGWQGTARGAFPCAKPVSLWLLCHTSVSWPREGVEAGAGVGAGGKLPYLSSLGVREEEGIPVDFEV